MHIVYDKSVDCNCVCVCVGVLLYNLFLRFRHSRKSDFEHTTTLLLMQSVPGHSLIIGAAAQALY